MCVKIKYFLSFCLNTLLLSCLVSCEKEIEIDTQNFDKHLVINAIFNANSPLVLHFSNTTRPTNRYESSKDSLQVFIFENNKLVLNAKTLSDSLSTNIIPSSFNNYSIKIKSLDQDTVFATDIIPRSIPIEHATFKKGVGYDKDGGEIKEVSVTFMDPPNEKNYYELLFVYVNSDNAVSNYYSTMYDVLELGVQDSVLLNEGDNNFYPTTHFFSDELFDGKQYTIKLKSFYNGNWSNQHVVLRSVSKSYYLYRKYYTRHFFNQPTQDFGIYGLFFKAEPQAMFTNIVNGYGIFAGYTESTPVILEQVKN